MIQLLPLRWRKVWRDLWTHPVRTALVVLSIAIGVFTIGVVVGTRRILSRDLAASFMAVNPASATIQTLAPFDDDMVRSVAAMPEVAEAEGRRTVFLRLQTGPDSWTNIQLIAIPNFDDIQLDKVRPVSGAWPPPEHGLLVERSALGLVKAGVGDQVVIKTPSGKRKTLLLAGTVFDPYALIYTFDGVAWAYVTYDTLEWLGVPRSFNELHLTVAEGRDDRSHVTDVVNAVRDKLERDGRAIFFMTIPEPGKHPLDSTIQALLLLLGAMGVLALVLSGFLVTNTMAALMTQELRQIGVMKAIGARRGQIAGMYAGMVVAYGLLALLVAVPLGMLGTYGFTHLMAGFLNLDVASFVLPLPVFGLQLVVGVLVPLAAAALPIWSGTRVTVREAIAAYGLGKGRFGSGWIDRAVEQVRGLSRPLLLSLRNTFRRKVRLALTVTTLTLAGAMFIAVQSVYGSMNQAVSELMSLYQFDVAVQFQKPYRSTQIMQAALEVPGVTGAEGWSYTTARHSSAEGGGNDQMLSFSVPLIMFAPPADTKMLKAPLIRGRWLLPEDENALVVTPGVLDDQPGLDVGGEIRLKIEGRDTLWRVVGVANGIGVAPMVFANYDYFSRMVRRTGRAEYLALATDRHDAEYQHAVAERLEARLEQRGLKVALLAEIAQERAEVAALFAGIVAMLLVMVLILAVVGSLGLAGTMSLNVIERTREIGVMRAIGATNGVLLRIFVVEGVIIGLISWLAAVLLSIPLAIAISRAVGEALLSNPLDFAFSISGTLIWFGIVVGVAALASLMPARSATRVSVREVLAYE